MTISRTPWDRCDAETASSHDTPLRGEADIGGQRQVPFVAAPEMGQPAFLVVAVGAPMVSCRGCSCGPDSAA